MCDQCQCREDADRAMWLGIANAIVTITRGLNGIVNAIRKRYDEQDEPRHTRRAS